MELINESEVFPRLGKVHHVWESWLLCLVLLTSSSHIRGLKPVSNQFQLSQLGERGGHGKRSVAKTMQVGSQLISM